ncbi:hypothetical protein J2T60_001169 [Natronospira proteinivora]|uniref:Transmembrane protein n=1 Tax=Natronospira proteinivora TaxID=1807133 RepID=A0ABT1G7C3_9GAMM|nr:hypothetical protein [Natronospira proteinivora]MCP1727204.1 hypothetical protein [Natronospira proteinivora]
MLSELLYIWSDSGALSVAIWLVIAMTVLYLGRPHAHQLLRSSGRALNQSLRLAAASIRGLEGQVSRRNRDVLLAMGREESEKAVERAFSRVNAVVERDLARYPELHRRLADVLAKVEADYQASATEAPLPPAWSEVVETVSALPSSGDPQVVKVLENIKSVVEKSHRETLKVHQKYLKERHKTLHAMQPEWRRLNQQMEQVQKSVSSLDEQTRQIDRHMENYESIRRGDDKSVHALTASSLTQFFIAALVLVIAAFGGLINFHLIALPMSEMVGGASYIGNVPVSDVAALVIIMVEISMGIFLLEALGVTRLFPMIGRMDDRMRRRMAIVAFSILFIFATIESSLAYMRDLLAQDREALAQTLAGTEMVEAQFRWIPSVAQMMLGFILPFALAFVAIPLEAFINSLRTVLGLLSLGVLRFVRVVLRTAGGLAGHGSKMLISVYDLFVMLPLGVERMVHSLREQAGNRAGRHDNRSNRAGKGRHKAADTDEQSLKPKEA